MKRGRQEEGGGAGPGPERADQEDEGERGEPRIKTRVEDARCGVEQKSSIEEHVRCSTLTGGERGVDLSVSG